MLRERLTYANVMSTLAVFLVLGTGTAYATHLVVNSSDVVDESLVSADLKNGSAVKSADVVNDTLTGTDIKEGTLSQVPAAMLGGLGRSAATASDFTCNPEENSAPLVRCVEVQLDLPRPARVLLNGRITAYPDQGGTSVVAHCRWAGVAQSGFVEEVADAAPEELSLVGVTGVLPAAQGYTFAIECDEVNGFAGTNYEDAWITAVAISPT
jgi:hypothetical protein